MTDPIPEINAASARLVQALLAVDRLAVQEILTQPYADLSSYQVVEMVVIPALETIGSGWDAGTFSLSQVYMSGRLCEEIFDQLLPPGDPARCHKRLPAFTQRNCDHFWWWRLNSPLSACGL